MPFTSLTDYIEENLERGYSIASIQDALINQGYSPQDINQAINQAKGDNQDKIETPLPTNSASKNFLFILIPILLIIVVGLSIFFFSNPSLKSIPNEIISEGTSFSLEEDQEIKFKLNEEEHIVKVNSVDEQSVSLTIQSDPIQVDIKIGEEKKFDLDNDGYFDIVVKLNDIQEGIPDLYIKKIHESTCTEDWSCRDWSECTEKGEQTRSCTDSNSCGTDKSKPLTTQECTYIEEEMESNTESYVEPCVKEGGVVCDGPDDQCPSGSRQMNGKNCCFGECYDTSKTCSELGGILVDNWNNCDGERILSAELRVKGTTGTCCIGKYEDKNSRIQCESAGGTLCPEICSGTVTSAIMQIQSKIKNGTCCVGVCKSYPKNCDDVDCPENMKCGTVESTGQLGCVFKTCVERGGIICDNSQICEGNTIFASIDGKYQSGCCLGQCKTEESDPCENIFCSYGEKCVGGECVLQTCSELNGVICKQNEECVGGQFRQSSDSQYCCDKIGPGDVSCQGITTCGSNDDCDDSNPSTFDYCYKSSTSECKYIPEQSNVFNLDSSKQVAMDRMEDDCLGNEIELAEGWDSKNNADPRPCASFNVWGWCKDWVLECEVDESSYGYQSVIYKTPGKNEYKFIGGAALP